MTTITCAYKSCAELSDMCTCRLALRRVDNLACVRVRLAPRCAAVGDSCAKFSSMCTWAVSPTVCGRGVFVYRALWDVYVYGRGLFVC